MNEQVLATLGAGARRLLLVEPPSSLLPPILKRPETSFVIVTSTRRKELVRLSKSVQSVVRAVGVDIMRGFVASAGAVPIGPGSVDVVVLASGLSTAEEPVESLRATRRLVRPGGAVVVVNQLREGAIGMAGSAIARASRRGRLPVDSDISSWMLLAGMREVRQAAVPSAVVPTVVTWAMVRRRPWEED